MGAIKQVRTKYWATDLVMRICSQFSSLMEVLRDMLEQVDKQRRNKMKLETVTIPVPHR